MDRARLINAALAWREKGIPVVPARYCAKSPIVKWTPWINRVQPEPLLKYWFTKNYPCNMAVVLSKGLCVVDFDTPIAYAKWQGENKFLSESYTVKTNRGWHVYMWLAMYEPHTYRFDGGEVKTNGIVVVPPSVHGSGKEYRTLNEDAGILGQAGVYDLGVRILGIESSYRKTTSGSLDKPLANSLDDNNTTVNRVLRTVDIALWLSRYTSLKDMGDGSLMGICPFHADSSPSLQVYPDERRCYCHSPVCRAHRYTDVIAAAAYIHDISMSQAVGLLASTL